VAELFEARRPKDAAEIAKIDGTVEMGGTVRGKRKLILKDPETGAEEEHLISLTKHIIVFKGDFVKKGQQLTEGPVVPHEILEVCGPQDLQEHLVNGSRRFIASKAWKLMTSTSRSSCARCCGRLRSPIQATVTSGAPKTDVRFEAENTQVVEQGASRQRRRRSRLHHEGPARDRQFIQRPHSRTPRASDGSGDASAKSTSPWFQGERHHNTSFRRHMPRRFANRAQELYKAGASPVDEPEIWRWDRARIKSVMRTRIGES
jgi:hypothetical protein